MLLLASVAVMVMYVEAMAFPSLPKVMISFGLTPKDYALASWVVTIYLIVGSVAIPIFGKLGDIYGKKKMLLIAMAIYSLMVTLTGFSRDISDSIYVMIAFRGVQGIAMCMFPLAFSIVRDEFPRDRIAIAQGVISAMFGVGTAIGFVVGGTVTDRLGWQWTYHTVFPFAFLATGIVAWKVRESPVRMKAKVDYLGAGLLGATLVSFLVGVTESRNRGWTDPLILSLLAASVVFAVLFSLQLGRARYPLIRPALLKQKDIALTSVVAFVIGFSLFTAYQTIAALAGFNFHLDATQIGILMLPTSAVTLVLGPTVGFLVRKIGPKWPMIIGMGISVVGFLLLYLSHDTQTNIMLWVTVTGAGNAFAMVASINMIIISTPPVETAISTAMNTILRTSGSVAGPAIAAVIISQNSQPVLLNGAVQFVPEDIAYRIIFMISAVVMAFGMAISLFMNNKRVLPDPRRHGPSASIPGEAAAITAAAVAGTAATAERPTRKLRKL